MTEYPARMFERTNSPEEALAQHQTLCIGVFDGVHRGHQKMLEVGRAVAQQCGTGLKVVTFDPHPSYVVKPDSAPLMISSIEERIELLLDQGADAVRVIPFTRELAQLTPDDFVQEYLAGCASVVVGRNFTFGAGAVGTVDTLASLGDTHGFTVHVVDLARDADGLTLSSSRVRDLVLAGDVKGAAHILGRPFTLSGEVIFGDQRGRELGYPTANLRWEADRLVPHEGVYGGFMDWNGHRYTAAISVGMNPQFNGVDKRVEAYVLDRDDLNLYGEQVKFGFVEYLRAQEVFPELDAYLEQMKVDVARTRAPEL